MDEDELKEVNDNAVLILDFIKGKTLNSFGDPLEFQKRARNEWNARELQIMQQMKLNAQNG